ncbi:UDP-N-acetylmuramoyl-tripeptide--D-alanyl-D-alanine ligase [Paenibacillus sp. MER 78]|nr:UDP-N-acetylmuramoyl-tripeptide--D-alanyl-D-alanine ligase [Paenibacillus sp. MER 78]
MIKRTLYQIAQMCGGTLLRDQDSELNIHGVYTDSRMPAEGRLFVPLAGERFDGHEYAAECLAAGAVGIMWQKDHGTPPEGPVIVVEDTLLALQELSAAYLRESGASVVAITGSNGKTTTKDMVYSLLSTTYKVHKTQGNFNNHIGLPLTILDMPQDTQITVLEMGMSSRHEIERLAEIARPDVAVITNIGEAHLLQLGSREEIARAKLEIVSGLKNDGLLIYNGDDSLADRVLAEPTTKKPKEFKRFTFGMNQTNNDFPTGITNHAGGMIFTSVSSGEEAMQIPLIGHHNVVNSLAALAVARHYGVSHDDMRKGLGEVKLTGMRIEVTKGVSGITVLNDAYNASPTAMKAAIDALSGLAGYERKAAVLGDMLELGPREEELHEEIGQYLTPAKLDLVFTYGSLSSNIAKGALLNMPNHAVFAFEDKAALTAHLKATMTPKDVVLVKASRGMKLEEVANALINEPLQIEVD